VTKSKELKYKKGLNLADSLTLLPQIPSGTVDLTITSPPYFVGKKYDESRSLEDFIKLHEKILPEVVRLTKEGGSICWQVGYHVSENLLTPLDYYIHNIMLQQPGIKLRNRIVWTFGHGLNTTRRFSGRHETVLWYTKGDDYLFDLNAVRVPQKYPGKTFHKGDKKGELSGNPLGKNPEDVWEIPNVKANHIEKTDHPCQFPVALALRLIRALCPKDGLLLDPFLGSGTTAAAAILENREYIAVEKDKHYFEIASARCESAKKHELTYRQDMPVMKPDPKSKVAIRPKHFNDKCYSEILELI
jgi:adenine-specific DNA-methyltransferase